jgi:hypothetical protein
VIPRQPALGQLRVQIVQDGLQPPDFLLVFLFRVDQRPDE